MGERHRAFIDWVAAYYLEPKGNVLRLAMRAPGVFGDEPQQIAYRRGAATPARMTPQRERVLALASEGMAMRGRDLAEAAGVGASVVKALAETGALESVPLPAHRPFARPDIGAGQLALSSGQEEAARRLRAYKDEIAETLAERSKLA